MAAWHARTVHVHSDGAGVHGEGTRSVQACALAGMQERPGLPAVALFPTVHLLRDRHGLLMTTYGRELATLNNEAGL